MEDEKSTVPTNAADLPKTLSDAKPATLAFVTIEQLRNAHTTPIYFAFEEQLTSSSSSSSPSKGIGPAFAERIWWIADLGDTKIKCAVSGRFFSTIQEVTIVARDGVAWITWYDGNSDEGVSMRMVLANSSARIKLRDEDRIMDLAALKRVEADWKYVKRAQIRAKGTADLAVVSHLIERAICGRINADPVKQFTDNMVVGQRVVHVTGEPAGSETFTMTTGSRSIVGRDDLNATGVTRARLNELRDYYGQYAVTPISLRFEQGSRNGSGDADCLCLYVEIPKEKS